MDTFTKENFFIHNNVNHVTNHIHWHSFFVLPLIIFLKLVIGFTEFMSKEVPNTVQKCSGDPTNQCALLLELALLGVCSVDSMFSIRANLVCKHPVVALVLYLSW
jgi:hypothetical protein